MLAVSNCSSGDSSTRAAGLSVTGEQCAWWLWGAYIHFLKTKGSLRNSKLLAEMVGHGVSAPVIMFFPLQRAKFSMLTVPGGHSQRHAAPAAARCAAFSQPSPHTCIWHLANQRHTAVGAVSYLGI